MLEASNGEAEASGGRVGIFEVIPLLPLLRESYLRSSPGGHSEAIQGKLHDAASDCRVATLL
jgi:hypothetical protein